MYKWTDGTTYLMHHGIKGQKWGVRRFQNEDGTLTTAGKERYSESSPTRPGRRATNVTGDAKQIYRRDKVGSTKGILSFLMEDHSSHPTSFDLPETYLGTEVSQTFIDEYATLQEKICISGGQRGVQIIINPEDLAKACDAQFVDLEL